MKVATEEEIRIVLGLRQWQDFEGKTKLEYSMLSPRESWEILSTRERIPLAWAHDDNRLFFNEDDVCCHCGIEYGHHVYETHSFVPYDDDKTSCASFWPTSLLDVVFFASRWQEMATAEARARELWRIDFKAVIWEAVTPQYAAQLRAADKIITENEEMKVLLHDYPIWHLDKEQLGLSIVDPNR